MNRALASVDIKRAYLCLDALTGRNISCPEKVSGPASVRALVEAWVRVPPALPGIPYRHPYS